MSAFTTVFRTHEGLNPDKNYQIFDSDETLEHFAKYAKIFAAWNFYRKQLIEEANTKGIPVIRHPYLEFPDDKNTQSIVYEQFMIGSEIMVAPVLEKNMVATSIYLPLGNWINLWDGSILNSNGQTFNITNLVDKPAVFYKENSSIGNQFRNNLMDEGFAE
jgi:alpha-glucosidase (family GH31 glycosyl hydrolase)